MMITSKVSGGRAGVVPHLDGILYPKLISRMFVNLGVKILLALEHGKDALHR